MRLEREKVAQLRSCAVEELSNLDRVGDNGRVYVVRGIDKVVGKGVCWMHTMYVGGCSDAWNKY